MSQEKEYKLICKRCGETFMSTASGLHFCQKCNIWAHKEAHKAEILKILGEIPKEEETTCVCERCGTTFTVFGHAISLCKDCRSALEAQFKMNDFIRHRETRRKRNANKLVSE